MIRWRVIGVGDDVLGELEAPDGDTAWAEARTRWPWRVCRIEATTRRAA